MTAALPPSIMDVPLPFFRGRCIFYRFFFRRSSNTEPEPRPPQSGTGACACAIHGHGGAHLRARLSVFLFFFVYAAVEGTGYFTGGQRGIVEGIWTALEKMQVDVVSSATVVECQ